MKPGVGGLVGDLVGVWCGGSHSEKSEIIFFFFFFS